MCGIFGFIKGENSIRLEPFLEDLFFLSENRGQDASGVAIETRDRITILKQSIPARKLVCTSEYTKMLVEGAEYKAVIGHARMETNGNYQISENNQPVVNSGCVTIHNGIIVNDSKLWAKYPEEKRIFQVDTEIVNTLIRKYLDDGLSLIDSYVKTLGELEGSYSLATLLSDYNYLLLSTNTGSLYLVKDNNNQVVYFTSEYFFTKKIIDKYFSEKNDWRIEQLKPLSGVCIDASNGEVVEFEIKDKCSLPNIPKSIKTKEVVIIKNEVSNENVKKIFVNTQSSEVIKEIESEYVKNIKLVDGIRRCTKCILPETMPFIEFDEFGVCNYCKNFTNKVIQDENILLEMLDKYRKKDGSPDCVVSFSGGRDSSYSLHYIKNILKMHPLAFSYDWGMLTDLGRRNQARMTGKLGIENILVSANIHKKRENIKKNVEAWLKRPNLGTIPLFMAGDKQYYYYANLIKKNYNLDLLLMGENYLEKTNFKNGFANVKQDQKGFMAYNVSGINKLKMLFFYAGEFIKNPSYINSSIIDSLGAFFSYFVIPHTYINLYDFVQWDEETINNTLINDYNWETADDIRSTWRIGDGTAAFYNYIYYTVAGFTENDTFRSNQIRSGIITREEALANVRDENKPRPKSIMWYCDTINIDMNNAIKIINKIEKKYV